MVKKSLTRKAQKKMDMEKILCDAEMFAAYLEQVRNGRRLTFYNYNTVECLTTEDFQLLFDVATVFRAFVESPQKKLAVSRGKSIINFFYESSTRTRISFELGGKHLGADTINFSEKGSSVDKGETIGDTARTLNNMKADLLICRSSEAGVPDLIAREVDCPVINAGDGWHEHPTQALFDIFTIFHHFGKLKGLKMCIVGDVLHSRVAGSLMRLSGMVGMDLSICAPQTLIPEEIGQFTNQIYYNFDEIVDRADVIFSLRLQGERDASRFVPSAREYSKCYGINRARLERMKKNAIVLHAGPVMREMDVMTEVLESPKCMVNEQVTNGFAMRMGLMWLMIGEHK